MMFANIILGLDRILIWPDIRPPDIRLIVLPDIRLNSKYRFKEKKKILKFLVFKKKYQHLLSQFQSHFILI